MARIDLHQNQCRECRELASRAPASARNNNMGVFRCEKCDRRDPMNSDDARGWLKGELGSSQS